MSGGGVRGRGGRVDAGYWSQGKEAGLMSGGGVTGGGGRVDVGCCHCVCYSVASTFDLLSHYHLLTPPRTRAHVHFTTTHCPLRALACPVAKSACCPHCLSLTTLGSGL